jgi:hypothetical protein
MACDWEPLESYWAFLLEHTGLPRQVIQSVLDANNRFWDMKVAQLGMEQAAQWADDDREPDGGGP